MSRGGGEKIENSKQTEILHWNGLFDIFVICALKYFSTQNLYGMAWQNDVHRNHFVCLFPLRLSDNQCFHLLRGLSATRTSYCF